MLRLLGSVAEKRVLSDFVAIDFETANENRDSACEIGLVRFSGGKVVDRFQSLVYQEYFNPFNVSMHGIPENHVAIAPSFDEVGLKPLGRLLPLLWQGNQ